MKTGIVALSGYNTRAVVAFCRFARAHDLIVHLLARDPQDPILYTDFRSWVLSIRTEKHLDMDTLIAAIQELKKAHGYEKLLFLPSSEFLNRFLLVNREYLEKNDVIVPLVGQELYETVSDKYAFGQLCTQHGMHVPAEMPRPTGEFPLVAKPRSYASMSKRQLKPYLLFSKDDMEVFAAKENLAEYYFQEYVHGDSFYLLFNISRNGEDVCYSQKNLIQQSGGGSVICAESSTLHLEPIANQYLSLFKKIGFFGLVMVELRKSNDKYYMIEANPRMWGPLQLVVDSGVPILGNFLKENGISLAAGEQECNTVSQSFQYFWAGGIVKDQSKQNSIALHSYTHADLVRNFSQLMQKDIFLRNDTLNLYFEEITGSISS